uniref:Uncharacterized protein n=1 Tax=Timema bartmani TaxID=61472 RepID=A0A7R9EXR4_9NEOP|nr:unnamed protein product [Timema bartmani]
MFKIVCTSSTYNELVCRLSAPPVCIMSLCVDCLHHQYVLVCRLSAPAISMWKQCLRRHARNRLNCRPHWWADELNVMFLLSGLQVTETSAFESQLDVLMVVFPYLALHANARRDLPTLSLFRESESAIGAERLETPPSYIRWRVGKEGVTSVLKGSHRVAYFLWSVAGRESMVIVKKIELEILMNFDVS